MFTVSLVVLLAATGACVDVGVLVVTRQRMQNAADLSSTTGASITDSADAPTVWLNTATYFADNVDPNGPAPQFLAAVYDPDDPSAQIGATYHVGSYTVTVQHPYHDSVTDAAGYGKDYLVRVDATTNMKTPLMSVVGIRQAPIAVRAVALGCPTGPCLLFAKSTDPSAVGIDWSSNGGTIKGDCHSNTTVDVSGNYQTCNGWIDYRYSYSYTGQDNYIEKGFRLGNVMDYPLNFSEADILAQPHYSFRGNLNFTGSSHMIPPGIYYVDGNLIITGDDVPAGPVTFLVTGDIKVSGTGHDFTAAYKDANGNPLLFMSLASDYKAIDITAQGGTWQGVCFAPNGNISYSASSQHIYDGGLEAMTLELTGQDFLAEGRLPPLPRFYSKLIR